jgi:hypothetical protein
MVLIVVLYSTAVLLLGYVVGTTRMRSNIAKAINEGDLSLEQRAIDVARQIESGVYKSVEEVAAERGEPWVKIETTKPLIR